MHSKTASMVVWIYLPREPGQIDAETCPSQRNQGSFCAMENLQYYCIDSCFGSDNIDGQRSIMGLQIGPQGRCRSSMD